MKLNLSKIIGIIEWLLNLAQWLMGSIQSGKGSGEAGKGSSEAAATETMKGVQGAAVPGLPADSAFRRPSAGNFSAGSLRKQFY